MRMKSFAQLKTGDTFMFIGGKSAGEIAIKNGGDDVWQNATNVLTGQAWHVSDNVIIKKIYILQAEPDKIYWIPAVV